MKLEKTWMGICVWVIYLVGMIFAIGVTGFVSGLFPFYDRYYVAGGTAAACIVAAVLIGLILNAIIQKIVKATGTDSAQKPLWLEILLPVAVLVAAFFVFGYSSSLVKDFTGNIDLYDSAIVAANGQNIELSSFADKAYVVFLKIFMGFLGNSLSTAYALHLCLRIMLILFLYVSLRVVLGMVPALVGCISVIAIPSFGYTLKSINSMQLASTAICLLLMLTVLYVYGFTRSSSIRWYYKALSIVYGAFLGFMIYFDAASASVIPFLIAAWVLYDMYGETINICVNEIIVLISGVLSFGGMLIYEGGMDSIPDTYYHWTWRFYGYNENAWLLMSKGSQYNTYLALGLLIAALIPAVLFFKKRCTKTSAMIMFSVLGIVSSVILGDTAANSEIMIISFVVILISCGIAAMIHVKEEKTVAAVKKSDDEESQGDAASDDESENEQEAAPEENIEDVQEEQTNDEKVISPETTELTSETEEQKEDSDQPESSQKEETPRYVPEGMVLPMGEEDEEDLVPNFNMNRPEMAEIGILSVGGAGSAANDVKEDVPAEEISEKSDSAEETSVDDSEDEEVSKKDDFDINIAEGDDFDI